MTATPPNPDVLVIGGGTAGCVVAGRLAAAGRRVTVIEAGPDYGPRTDPAWPADLLDGRTLPTSHDWGYRGPGGAGQPLTLDRCRAIGGCSTHNGTTQNVGWSGDYDRWAAEGSPGWDAASLRPHFDAALRAFEARRYAADEIQPFHRALLDAAADRGLARADDLDQLDAGAGAGCAPVSSSPDGIRINAGFAYLDPVRESGRLRVLADAVVDRIVIEDGRATGVDVLRDGRRERLSADLVVLSAGAFGSPEVLLRSGVGPADHLAEVGVPLVHALPGVGRNLHDQPTAMIELAGSAALAEALAAFAADRLLVEEQTIVKLRSPYAGDAPYDLHVFPWIEPDDRLEHGWRCVFPIGLLRPRSRGSVRLGSADPDDRALVETGYLRDPDDLAAVLHGLTWAQALIRTPPLAALLGEPLLAPPADGDVGAWVRRTHQHYWHPVGSCRMGPADDPRSVVDHRGQVHGIAGLHVADASVFPDTPRGTTALPTAVVGERIAAFLLNETEN